jgi:hypothetical protein
MFAPLMLGILAYWNKISCEMLVECYNKCKYDAFPETVSSIYSKIAYSGAGWLGVAITDASIVITLIGVCISYQMTFVALFHEIPGVTLSKTTLTLLFALIVYPVSCARSVGPLSKFSLAGLVCLVGAVVAILGYGFVRYGPELVDTAEEEHISLQYWPHSVDDLAAYIGIATFGYGICSVAFPVYESMADKSKFGSAVLYSLLFVWGVYATVGNVACALFVHDTNGIADNILSNLPHDSVASSLVRASMACVSSTSFFFFFTLYVADSNAFL